MSLDPRLAAHLERIGQADRALREQGRDPEPFLLIHAGGMTREILHAAWDDSWATPTSEDIDDLGDLDHLRVEPPTDKKRHFALKAKGREQAALLADKRVPPTGGRAPSLDRVLDWLCDQERDAVGNLESPGRLVPAAVASGFIEGAAREALATRILDLRAQAFLEGYVPDYEQAGDEQRLGLCDGLRLTMKAHEHVKGKGKGQGHGSGGNTVNFNGSVVAGQIAAGDIANYVSFGDLLDRAAEEIAALEDIDTETREEATGLIDVLRGKGLEAGAIVLTGAGGELLATVLGQLLGLPATV